MTITKKKGFFVRLMSLALALVCAIGCFSVTPAYAAENGDAIPHFPLSGTVPYATTYHIFNPEDGDVGIHHFSIEDNETLGTFTLADDPRIHRARIQATFCRGLYDMGNGPVKLTLRVTSNLGFDQTYTAVSEMDYTDVVLDTFWITAHQNERFTLWVDASTPAGYTPNGYYRSLFFDDFAMYCD